MSLIEEPLCPKRMPLDIFVDEINERITEYRGDVRSKAVKVFPEMILPPNNRFTGEAYVESAGSIVRFDVGNFPNYYEKRIMMTRDAGLRMLFEPRKELFENLAQTLPDDSRVLNIGAGGDVIPIQKYVEAGHEVISTDFSQEVIDILRRRINAPGFACDLTNLSKFVPENSIDVLIGNSVMGYLNIDKVSDVVDNLDSVMSEGAIFTFDLTPHPSYFTVLTDSDDKNVINDSAPDPAVLIRLMEEHGVSDGIKLMSHYQFAVNYSIQGGAMLVLKELFEDKGWKVVFGVQEMNTSIDGAKLVHTLRIGKRDDSKTLLPVNGEAIFTEFNDTYWDYIKNAQARSIYSLFCIDRHWASSLSKVIGREMTTWEIIDYVEKEQRGDVSKEKVSTILEGISPEKIYSQLIGYVRRKEAFPTLNPLSDIRGLEQVLHKQSYLGEGPFAYLSRTEVINRMDIEYEKTALKQKKKDQDKRKKACQRKEQEEKAKARKNARKSRKKRRK